MPLQVSAETFVPSEVLQRQVTNIGSSVNQGATASYVLGLQVAGGGTLVNTDITTATLTLYDEETKSVINSRHNQDVLGVSKTGANNVVVSVSSTFTWSMQALDNAYVDPTLTKRIEYHRAIFTIVYNSGAGAETLIHELKFPVKRSFSPE